MGIIDWNSDSLEAVHGDLMKMKDKPGTTEEPMATLLDELTYLVEQIDGYFGYMEEILIEDESTKLLRHIRKHRHMEDGTVVEEL
jgi:hypothetical protein